MKEQFSKLFEAYTGGNIKERPERLKQLVKDMDKLPLVEDFAGFVDTWIDGWYNCQPSRAEGMNGRTPNEAYAYYLEEKRVASEDDLNLMLMRSTRLQKVKRDGVKLTFYGHDKYYFSEELYRDHMSEQVYIRYNPDDLSEVRIYDSEERYLMTCPELRSLGYDATKEEIKQRMAENRRLERTVKNYKKEKAIEAESAFDLIMAAAEENIKNGEEPLNPKVLTIMRPPEYDPSKASAAETAAVGQAEPIDLAAMNERLRKYKETGK